MKTLKILGASLFVAALIFACGKEKNNDIIGTWTISELHSTADIPDDAKANYEESMEDYKKTYLLIIKPDSTFEHTISETTSEGKWDLSPDTKTLTLVYGNGEKEVSNVIELSEDKMVTSVEFNDATNTITFVKKKEEKE